MSQKLYRATRTINAGSVRYEAGAEFALADEQAADLVAAGSIVPVETAAAPVESKPKAKPAKAAEGDKA